MPTIILLIFLLDAEQFIADFRISRENYSIWHDGIEVNKVT
jgi:hypothetical protein